MIICLRTILIYIYINNNKITHNKNNLKSLYIIEKSYNRLNIYEYTKTINERNIRKIYYLSKINIIYTTKYIYRYK